MSDPRTRPLLEDGADPDPFRQLDGWFADAVEHAVPMPEAVALATATTDGRPSVRMVLCRGFGPDGFVFYSDRRSRKGDELGANPRAALLFSWEAVGRQVRVEGAVSTLDDALADAYFASRPRGSQLGAWASAQSTVLGTRAELEAGLRSIGDAYAGETVPRPQHWGGYRLRAETLEFWQHRDDRLHDRLRYRAVADGWLRERLAP